MRKQLVLLASSVVLAACATTQDEPAATYHEPTAPLPDLGLALYEPRSDVADLTNAVRHVLNPADPYGIALSHLALEYRAQPARFGREEPTPVKRVDAPVVVAQLDKVHDPIYEAWRKYCNNAENMTQEEWGLIDRSEMPAELAAIWADECVPLK